MCEDDPVTAPEELHADRRAVCGHRLGAERSMRGVQHDGCGHLARRACDVIGHAADAMITGDRRDAFDDLRERHGHAVDGHGKTTLEGDLQMRRRIGRARGRGRQRVDLFRQLVARVRGPAFD